MRLGLLRSTIPATTPTNDFAKTAERIDVLFRVETLGDPRNTILDRGIHPPRTMGRECDAAFAKLL